MEQPGSLIIRIAFKTDAVLLSELGAATFRETFAADNAPEDMAAYLRDTFTSERLMAELTDPAVTFFIAELSANPVGYAKLRAGESEPCVTGAEPLELVRLYVLAEYIGHKIGAALMEACHQQARKDGGKTLWLGVWERNERALNFYRKWGFEPVGSHIFQLGRDSQTDLILQKSLG